MTDQEFNANANDAAAELGHDWIGVEHFVLAVLRDRRGSPAADALRACGITYETLAEAIGALPSDYGKQEQVSRSPGPGRVVGLEGMMFLGRAEGLAAGLGSRTVLPEHLVLSVLWGSVRSVTEDVLERLGASRYRIHEKFTELGVKMPTVPLPRRIQWSEFRVVSESELEESQIEFDSTGVRYRIARRGESLLLSVSQGWERRDQA